MKPHDAQILALVVSLLDSREWPEPAETNEAFAEAILDALVEAKAVKVRRGPEYWADDMGRWVTVPSLPA